MKNIEKGLKKNQESLGDLWDNIKTTNIYVIGIPKGEKREEAANKNVR